MRRHDVGGHTAERPRLATRRPPARSTAARHPASPTKQTAPGSEPAPRAARPAPARSRYSSRGSSAARRVAALHEIGHADAVRDERVVAGRGPGSRAPAASAAGQKRLPGRANPTPRRRRTMLGLSPHTRSRIPGADGVGQRPQSLGSHGRASPAVVTRTPIRRSTAATGPGPPRRAARPRGDPRARSPTRRGHRSGGSAVRSSEVRTVL